ncbi:polysaccharide deacetylase family protein [Bacillus sp. JCM 19034]|uniref:polysaccharide deacetylase family protein n=1 Tax=Bacillus sp. JCM 19034 TaxID=1481928 RepID=UPI0007805C81|nr:polysaccharide deacetylase family protein [Bacillus sp. JCM 19034]
MTKKIQLFIICVLSVLLFFFILDRNKTISTNSIENEQLISEATEHNLAEHKFEVVKANDDHMADDEFIANEEPEVEGIEVEEPINNDEDLRKPVYLTFDDGPSPATSAILDTLQEYDAKATFFMLEPAMRTYPDLVLRTVKDGHAVALHGVTHVTEKFYHSEQSALEEMTTAQETLENITGIQSHLIRTPYGSIPYFTDSFRDVLAESGFKLWDWNVDSIDWILSKDEFVQNVIAQIEKVDEAGNTPIILLHDRSETAEYLSNLLIYLLQNNYRTEIIDEDAEPYSFNCYDRCYRYGG